ncbi:MAG: hypothetical protein LBK56_15280 [Gracilibacteraceae bacterium]|jgi:hypothetical protein|nr:hypothetical protein [Gracilibacteraceae bacterium]
MRPGGGRHSRKIWLIWLLGICFCQGILWLALDAQARQWLLPTPASDRTFVLRLPFAAADDLQLSPSSRYLSALSAGELRVFRLGTPQPLRERAVAACWLPDRDAVAVIKTEGADAVLVTLELTGSGGADFAARETYRVVLPAVPRGARFAFSVYRDEMYIQPRPYPGEVADDESDVWFLDARGVTVVSGGLPGGETVWAPPGLSRPAGEWRADASVLAPAPDGFSRLKLTWPDSETCEANWETLP